VTLLSSKEPYRQTYRQTDTQTHRAYKWLQVPPFNLTVNVGNYKIKINVYADIYIEHEAIDKTMQSYPV